jgi:hypothetical protein
LYLHAGSGVGPLESINEVLEEFIDANDLRSHVDSVRLQQEWSNILESPLSDNLTVQSFDDGRVLLLASNPSWSQEASYQKNQIRQEINDYFDYDLVESLRIKH